MRALIQLSPETRGLLAEAFPNGMEPRAPRRSELTRTARAARELLWTSHREELGYCAAARAYVMEFASEQFEGLGYSAPNHREYERVANDVVKRRSASNSQISLEGACRLAFNLVPNGSSRIRLGVTLRRLDLIGTRADWESAYLASSHREQLAAGSAQNAGLIAGSLGDWDLAAENYLQAYELGGSSGDLLLAWILHSHVGASTHSLPSLDAESVVRLGDGSVLSGVAHACTKFSIPESSWLASAVQGDLGPLHEALVRRSNGRGKR